MKRVIERVKELEAAKREEKANLMVILKKALTDKSPSVRGLAAEIIGEREIAEMLPSLFLALTDPSAEVRMFAVESIGRLPLNKASINALTKMLWDRDELVRTTAVDALRSVRRPDLFASLTKALDDRSPIVRSSAAAAIGDIGLAKGFRVLSSRLSSEKDEHAQIGLLLGLIKLGHEEYLEQLLDFLRSGNYRIRCATANSILELTDSIKNKPLVLKKLREALKKERTVAARSSISNALNALKS